jgi:hypothetical protein
MENARVFACYQREPNPHDLLSRGHPRGLIMFQQTDENKYRVGMSFCSEDDQFSKAYARELTRSRMEQDYITIELRDSDLENVDTDVVVIQGDDFPDEHIPIMMNMVDSLAWTIKKIVKYHSGDPNPKIVSAEVVTNEENTQ